MYLITATLPSGTGLAKDAVVNTFSFTSVAALPDADVQDLMLAVQDFYNAIPAGSAGKLASVLSPALSRTASAARTRAYFITGAGLTGAPHGSPQLEDAFTLDAANDGNAAPSEVALALTLHGNGRSTAPVEGPNETRPRARRTGKIYFGPLVEGQLAGLGSPSRPGATLTALLRNAGAALAAASDALGQPWSVWSRADGSLYPLEAVSTDNAWDTQRRRGEGPTARTVLAV